MRQIVIVLALLILVILSDSSFAFSTLQSTPFILRTTRTTEFYSSSSLGSSNRIGVGCGATISRVGVSGNSAAVNKPASPFSIRYPTGLASATTGSDDGSGDDEFLTPSGTYNVDWNALLIKYPVGLAVQMVLIFGFLTGMDYVTSCLLQLTAKQRIPLVLNFIFFYVFNSKTSTFSILPNKRKETKEGDGVDTWEYNKRNRPTWTPPGIVFAIMWPIFVFGIRAFTASRIVQRIPGGRYANSAIMSLMFHLGIGNLWNTVNNVERRLGVSVIVLYGLWLSKAFAAWRFYKIDPFAGKLLALTLTWLTAAAALETRMWQINPDITTSNNDDNNTGSQETTTPKLEPLYPGKHPKWKTKFRWE